MSIFDDREKAAEAAFRQEQDLAFRITARRNRMLGIWAAARLGLIGEAATRYALSVVDAEIGGGDEAVTAKLLEDLAAGGIPASGEQVSRKLAAFAKLARAELLAAAPGTSQPDTSAAASPAAEIAPHQDDDRTDSDPGSARD